MALLAFSLRLGLFLFLIKGFQWSGCSDNLSYGVAFSQTFVDEPERAKGLSAGRPLMNLHNNESGRKVGSGRPLANVPFTCRPDAHSSCPRQAILHNMQVECKCHGVSGSCELRTCWKVMPPFRRVGIVLKERFDGATEVRLHGNPLKNPQVSPCVSTLCLLGSLDPNRLQNGPAPPRSPGETPRCQRPPLSRTLSRFLPSRSRERDPGDGWSEM